MFRNLLNALVRTGGTHSFILTQRKTFENVFPVFLNLTFVVGATLCGRPQGRGAATQGCPYDVHGHRCCFP